MLQLKEVKNEIVAGRATKKKFDFFIQWHLTERCNLRCSHCYQHGKRTRETAVEGIKSQIDGAAEMFRDWESEYGISLSPSIHFTGGEPLLYRGLWEAAAHAGLRGFKVAVLTNGCLIDRETAEKAASLKISDIQISLEGPQDIHDAIRGAGSFSAALNGARLLAGSGNYVSANMTLSRLNMKRIAETAQIAREAGFSALGLSRLVPCGSGEGMLESMLLPRELKSAWRRAFALSSPSFEVVSGDPLAGVLAGFKPDPRSTLALAGCSAGFSGITITSDGSVMPCRRIGIKIGSLHRNSLRQIWAGSKILWQLRKRESYRGECGKCRLWASCRGCRAVAYAFSRLHGRADLFADDPQCWKLR
jgi:radical SAM protein with 4Fe4S-binding SPASM domain